jgi:hypothetical protein
MRVAEVVGTMSDAHKRLSSRVIWLLTNTQELESGTNPPTHANAFVMPPGDLETAGKVLIRPE